MTQLDGPLPCPICDLLDDGRGCTHDVYGQPGSRVYGHGHSEPIPTPVPAQADDRPRKGRRMRRGPSEHRAHLAAGEDRCSSP